MKQALFAKPVIFYPNRPFSLSL